MHITEDQTVILDSIPLASDEAAFYSIAGSKLGALRKGDFSSQLGSALSIARPKALYCPVSITHPQPYSVALEDQKIDSLVVSDNLQSLQRCFVYVVTCGRELSLWKDRFELAVERFFVDVFCEYALHAAHEFLQAHLQDTFHCRHLAWMNPGSTRGWQLEDQALLFGLLGDVKARIGVELRESYFMIPVHSASGILFETESDYSNCQLCAREICPNRSAPYQGDAYQEVLDCTRSIS